MEHFPVVVMWIFGTDVHRLCVPDLGEEDERQHEDADLPGAAAEGGLRHPPTVGRLNLDLVSVPLPHPSVHPLWIHLISLFLFFCPHDSMPLVLYGLQNRLKQIQW